MPLSRRTRVLYAYPQQDQADQEAEHPVVQPTPEMIMADILGKRLAAHCAEFCQVYGNYCLMTQFYQSKTARPISLSNIDNFLTAQDHTGALRSFKMNVDDAGAFVESWKAGNAHEEHLSYALGLCALKMRKAADAIANYYLTLSGPAATVLKTCAGQQLDLILELTKRQNNDARFGHAKPR